MHNIYRHHHASSVFITSLELYSVYSIKKIAVIFRIEISFMVYLNVLVNSLFLSITTSKGHSHRSVHFLGRISHVCGQVVHVLSQNQFS